MNKNEIFKYTAGATMGAFAAAAAINAYVIASTRPNIVFTMKKNFYRLPLNIGDSLREKGLDAIVVPGALLRDVDTPTPMLRERLDAAVELYESGCADLILLSGDDGKNRQNEIRVMKNYVISKGVPEADVICDREGYTTSMTMKRAKQVFGIESAVICTQSYHLYRCIDNGRMVGIKTWGVATDIEPHKRQGKREVREVLARCKDFVKNRLGRDSDRYFYSIRCGGRCETI